MKLLNEQDCPVGSVVALRFGTWPSYDYMEVVIQDWEGSYVRYTGALISKPDMHYGDWTKVSRWGLNQRIVKVVRRGWPKGGDTGGIS